MKFELYSAVDTRDNKPMLWLVSLDDSSVALFNSKTAPSRIKRNSLSPNSIVWEHGLNFDLFADAVYLDSKMLKEILPALQHFVDTGALPE